MNSGILILTPLTLVSLGCLTRFPPRFHLVIVEEKSNLMLVRCCTRHFSYFSSVCEYMRVMVVRYVCLCIAELSIHSWKHSAWGRMPSIQNQALFTNVQTLISTHAYQSFTPCFAGACTLRLSLAWLTLSRWRVPPLPSQSLFVVFVCFLGF